MTSGSVRLVAARPARPRPALSPAQRAVVDHRGPALLVLGAPGSGRTTTALALVADRLAGGVPGAQVLLLAPTRTAAARLRDEVTAHLPAGTVPPAVRTPAALAFAVLRARAALDGEPAPVLLSGPEQDLELGELLAGHATGEVPGPEWGPRVPDEALGLRGFRDELRDLLMRAAERGLTPADLAFLGHRHERPEWVAAAAVYAEYLDVLDLGASTPDRGHRHDPAAVVDVAADVLEAWRAEDEAAGGAARRPRFSHVVVDDHQESTAATARLLAVLAADGASLTLLADPDAAVQGFRGAEPRLVARAGLDPATGEPGAFGAETLLLPEVWRHGPELRAVAQAVSARVRGTERAHRAAAAAADRLRGEVAVRHLLSPAQEAAAAVLALRHAHLRGGLDWDRMAVIARSGGRIAALRRALAAAGIPVTVSAADTPLPAEPAVRPLLLALGCVTRDTPADAEEAATLLQSPIGGLDSVGLRRLRRALRTAELAGGGGRASDALLVEAVADPAHAALLPPAHRGPATRVARVLAAGRGAAARPGATALDVLWALWDATGLAEPWRDTALAGGAGGARADADLDAVLALFKAAERFADRMPGAPAVAFLDHLRSQELPGDVLAAHGDAGPAVALLTPAGAAGREWVLVVVAGVQEGTWPDLRLRDSLLGAQDLVDVVAGRGARADGPAGYAEARAAVLDDELRAFVTAVSRARRALLVTAVADDDNQPSPLLDLVTPTPGVHLLPAAYATTGEDRTLEVPAALDLRSVVAQTRALAEHGDEGAVDLLAALAEAGRAEADPASWYGVVEPSTTAPLHGPEDEVPLSPSKLQQLSDCTLRWALESAGGTMSASYDQSVGTLIHAIAAEHPTGPTSVLLAELDRRWSELGLGDGWDARRQHAKAAESVRKLGAYLAAADPAVGIEAGFTARVGRALLRGSADRIERVEADGETRLRVVDLKTGGTAIAVPEGETNLQLLAYQLAVESGGLELEGRAVHSAGAHLVYVGTPAVKPTLRTQSSLADPARRAAAEERIALLVDSATGSELVATTSPGCRTCPVRRSCPLQVEGRTVGVDRG